MAKAEGSVVSPIMGLEKFNFKKSEFVLFKERLEQTFIVNNVTGMERKRAILLSSLNEESYKLLRDLCTPISPALKSYEDIIKILMDFFSPVKSIFAERLKFYCAAKSEHETVSEWSARLKSLASTCSFKPQELEVVLCDIFTIGLGENSIRDRCFEEDPTLASTTMKKMLMVAQSKEASLNEKHSSGSINIKSEPVHFSGHRRKFSGYRSDHSRTQWSGTGPQTTAPGTASPRGQGRQQHKGQGNQTPAQPSKCSVCGRRNHKFSDCSFRNCFCHKCGIKGHLASICKRKNVNNSQNFLSEGDPTEENIYNLHSIELDNKGNVKPTFIKLLVENVPINFEADSGFAHAAISEKLYLKYFSNKMLNSNDLSLETYVGQIFKPLGYINLNVVFDENVKLKVYVIRNGGPPLNK